MESFIELHAYLNSGYASAVMHGTNRIVVVIEICPNLASHDACYNRLLTFLGHSPGDCGD